MIAEEALPEMGRQEEVGEMAAAMEQRKLDLVNERTKPPFLRRVRIKGYKSIAFCDVPLQPLTILVGRNGAGKSNFLDALAFLRDVMETNVAEAVKRRGGWSSIVCRTAKQSGIEFEIEVAFDCLAGPEGLAHPAYGSVSGSKTGSSSCSRSGGIRSGGGPAASVNVLARYQLHLNAEGFSPPTITREALELRCPDAQMEAGFEVVNGVIDRWRSGPEAASSFDLPHSAKLLDIVRPDIPVLGLIGTQPFVLLGDGLRFMGFYNFHPEAIRQLQTPSRGSLLERDGSNLASAILTLRECDEATLQRVRDYLTLINEDVKDFEVATYGGYETVRFDLEVARRSPLIHFDASGMSDGTLRALAALVAAFQVHLPDGPTVIGIEEPETSLHPAAMQALMDAMDEATARTQVLLTTHSAELLSGRDVAPGQVLIVRSRAGQTQLTPIDSASREIIEKELYSLADLHRIDRLDLNEADLKRQARMSNVAEEA